LQEAVENFQGASGALMARNAIDDHGEFVIGLKRTSVKQTSELREAFLPQLTTPHTHFCTQIERTSPTNCSVIFVISSSILNFKVLGTI
jgi:hypothetical protein